MFTSMSLGFVRGLMRAPTNRVGVSGDTHENGGRPFGIPRPAAVVSHAGAACGQEVAGGLDQTGVPESNGQRVREQSESRNGRLW